VGWGVACLGMTRRRRKVRFCGMRIARFERMGEKEGWVLPVWDGRWRRGAESQLEWFCSIFFLFFLSDFQRKIE